MTDAAAVIVAARFAFDVAALFLWGAGFYLWRLVPAEIGAGLWRRLSAARLTAFAGLVLAVVVTLPSRTALLGDGWSSVTDSTLIGSLLWNTSIGTAWLVQAALAGALALLVLARRDSPAVTAPMAAALLASTTLTGHAATYEGWLRALHQANAVLHLLSVGAWIGALVPLLLVLPLLANRATAAGAGLALTRFSTMGHVAVALVLVSGGINTVLIVGGLPTDTRSAYQVLLIVKIAVVGAMVSLAVVNRYLLVPRLRLWIGAPKALVAGTLAELVLAAAAIALVAWFGTLQPTQ
ncbi:MAG: copper homeostasis membrane protein CopD [Mesorhizobium sp.]|jgi:putative copper resistance protein D|nr:copper homeostasis membrane protein CopD [Mesorhizobium sp.]MBL8577228.1 copper homeostasis membrane protein CopD [Mesorhizobium sp.]